MTTGWRISIFGEPFIVPPVLSKELERVREDLRDLDQIVRSGERRRPKVMGLIPRTPEHLSPRERFEELEGLERAHDAIADQLKERGTALRELIDSLTKGARQGLGDVGQRLLELDKTRREVRDLGQENGDPRLNDGATRSKVRLQIAVRVLARATLLILDRLEVCLDHLSRLEARQTHQRELVQNLATRLQGERKLLELEEALEPKGRKPPTDALALDLDTYLEDFLVPLQRLLDDVAATDKALRRTIGELRSIAEVVGAGGDESDLPSLGRGELLFADLMRPEPRETDGDESDEDGRPQPSVASAVENVLNYIEVKLGASPTRRSAERRNIGHRRSPKRSVKESSRPTSRLPKTKARGSTATTRPRKKTSLTDVPLRKEFVEISPGSFRMGSPPDEPGRYDREGPQEISLTVPYAITRTPVTQADFREAMGYEPSHFKHPKRPVERLSWHEAAAYCNMLSIEDGLEPTYLCIGSGTRSRCEVDPSWSIPERCPGYRLPTEAEWEYAARAGTITATAVGDLTWAHIQRSDGTNPIHEPIAWFFGNSGVSTHRVALKKANPWGLYDVLGNVEEWCHDWYAARPQNPKIDPVGPRRGTERVIRGGSHKSLARTCRVAYREGRRPTVRSADLGFRPVRSLPGG